MTLLWLCNWFLGLGRNAGHILPHTQKDWVFLQSPEEQVAAIACMGDAHAETLSLFHASPFMAKQQVGFNHSNPTTTKLLLSQH